MIVTQKTRRKLRLQGTLLVLLTAGIIGLLAWLSTRYTYSADCTQAGRHTLSEASTKLLERFKEPLAITAYARPHQETHDVIQGLVDRYRRVKPDISLRFVNPDTVPDEVRRAGVRSDGELVVQYAGRAEHVEEHSEERLTNALQRLLRDEERWVVFLEGHGERSTVAEANHDVSEWAAQLRRRGLKVQGLNLVDKPVIPDNTSVLVIASPEVALLPGEIEIITRYLNDGGNLLWLAEPDTLHGLEPLAERLGIQFDAGTIVDPATALFGIDHPAMVPAAKYGATAPVEGFGKLSIFPYARSLRVETKDDWQAAPLITIGAQAWAETGKLDGELAYDDGKDRKGPLDIAVRLTRPRPHGGSPIKTGAQPDDKNSLKGAGEQRILVIGDGDFLANAYLGNGGNLDLGLRVVSWLASDEALIDIPALATVDGTLTLTDAQSAFISIGFLIGLPGFFITVGLYIWMRRKYA
ncbi:MAG: GldG family protein [Gammaproteobacteria bacterium]